MFVGKADISLDEKNRVTLPSKFRAFLASPEDRKGFFVAPGPDGRCLAFYPLSFWRKVVERVRSAAEASKNPHDVLSLVAAQSEFVTMDAQGRVVLPRELLRGLGGPLVMVGSFDWIELWTAAAWAARQKAVRTPYAALRRQLLGFGRGKA